MPTYRGFKARLTRAERSGDPHAVIRVADDFDAWCGDVGMWPDDWARWDRAREDARLAIRWAPSPGSAVRGGRAS